MAELHDQVPSRDALTHFLKCALRPTNENRNELEELLGPKLDWLLQSLTNEQTMELAVDLVKALLELPMGMDFISRPESCQVLQACVQHPEIRLRRVVLDALSRQVATPALGPAALFRCGHFPTVSALLADEDSGVALKAQKVLVALMRDDAACIYLQQHSDLLAPLRQIVEAPGRSGSSLAMRVMDCFVETAAFDSPTVFQFCEATGMLDVVVNGVLGTNNDLLMLLNYLTLMEHITATPAGVAYLLRFSALFPRLLSLAKNSDPSIAGFGMKCIAGICQRSDDACQAALNHGWHQVLFQTLSHSDIDPEILQSCIEALGTLASTPRGLSCLLTQPQVCAHLADVAVGGMRDLKICALHSLAVVFGSEQLASNDLQTFATTIYDGPEGIMRFDGMLQLARQFDQDVRMGALHLLHALSAHLWGSLRLASTPGFLAWLTNRSNESEKEGLEYKFGIGQHMHRHIEDITNTIGGPASMELRVFVRLGPFSGGDRLAAVMPVEAEQG